MLFAEILFNGRDYQILSDGVDGVVYSRNKIIGVIRGV